MSIVLLIMMIPVLSIVALAVRFGGGSRPLNVVDYAQIQDVAAYNRWAGNRLLLLPLLALIFTIVAAQRHALAVPLLIFLFGAILVVLFWVVIGNRSGGVLKNSTRRPPHR
jgi:hypothetical protein